MSVVNSVLATVRTEPVRTLLYPVLVAIGGLLVAKGFLTEFSADTIVTLIAAAILGIPATELARRKVWPDVKVRAAVSEASRSGSERG